MIKKYWPLIAAVVIALLAFLLLKPEANTTVIVTTKALPAGHLLTADDLTTREMPDSMVPEGTALDATYLIGKSIKTDLAAGDLIRRDDLGEPIQLGANERGITIKVDDASGLGGILNPGDRIGIVAIIFGQNAAYSKVTVEGLRVLWISPEFRRGFTSFNTDTSSGSTVSSMQDRTNAGVVLVAVPVDWMIVSYDFTNLDPASQPVEKKINVIELLASLNMSSNARVQLYLMPDEVGDTQMNSSGLFVNDLMLVPTVTDTLEPTATLRPGETREATTPTLSPTPTTNP
ncbi:MAG: RcpC/CpaB family pilus assembly protein [Anaerolineales bacterium]